MLSSSCRTNKIVEKTIVYIPEINFPEFPKMGECVVNGDGTATIEENYLRQLLIFREEYQTEIDKYNAKIEKIGGKENEL